MKVPEKRTFEKIVGIATIIGCIATIIGLFMVKKIINNTTTVINEQTTYNNQYNQLMSLFYNIGITKIDTIVVNNKDTVYIQTPAPIKIIREDTDDTVLLTLPPHRMSPENLHFENYRKDFTKFKEEQINEFNKFKEQNR